MEFADEAAARLQDGAEGTSKEAKSRVGLAVGEGSIEFGTAVRLCRRVEEPAELPVELAAELLEEPWDETAASELIESGRHESVRSNGVAGEVRDKRFTKLPESEELAQR